MPRSEKTTWEPEWEEDVEETGRRGRTRRREPLLPSTKMLIFTVGFWVAACILLVLGWVGGNGGSDASVLTFLLICLVVATIASAFSTFFAVFGVFRFRRYKLWNLLMVVLSLVTNPVLLVFLVVRGQTMA